MLTMRSSLSLILAKGMDLMFHATAYHRIANEENNGAEVSP